jgi:hypothetical protein
MITHDPRWSLPRGNPPVPSRWQATPGQGELREVSGALTRQQPFATFRSVNVADCDGPSILLEDAT